MVSCDTRYSWPGGYKRASVRAICSGDQRSRSRWITRADKIDSECSFIAGLPQRLRCRKQTRGMCAVIARGAGIALEFAAEGRRGSAQLPRDGSYAVVLLPQAGNSDAVFRLAQVIVRGGGWHLRTLQVGRCCTSLLNPPCNLHKCMSNAFRGVKRMAFEISQADLDNKMSGTPFNTGTIPAKK